MKGHWSVQECEEGLTFNDGYISASYRSESGGCLYNIQWSEENQVRTIAQFRAQLHYGLFYERWSYNRLKQTAVLKGPAADLKVDVDGSALRILQRDQLHDFTLETEYTLRAGQLSITLRHRITKNEPGLMKAQCAFQLHIPWNPLQDPIHYWELESLKEQELLSDQDPPEGAIFDQSNQVQKRFRRLRTPVVRLTNAQRKRSSELRLKANELLSCLEITSSARGACLTELYSADRPLKQGESLESLATLNLSVSPGKVSPRAIPARDTHIDPVIADANDLSPQTPLEQLRKKLALWKCKQARWYNSTGDTGQCHAELEDAKSAIQWVRTPPQISIKKEPNEPILYHNSLIRFPADWDVFGFGKITEDPVMGLHLAPITTMNMWTHATFDGDFRIAFEYYPTTPYPIGGTFLQVCATLHGGRDSTDWMASSTGYMPDYNYGIACYHLSFNRGNNSGGQDRPVEGVCNFRRTGSAFRLLAQVDEAMGDTHRWYALELLRRGNHFIFSVEGDPVLEYYDAGHHGAPLSSGRIGLRNWGGQAAWFRNLTVRRPS